MEDEDTPVEIVINASDECVEGIVSTLRTEKLRRKTVEADFTVTAVKLGGFFEYQDDPPSLDEQGERRVNKGFTLNWETKSAGFGELAICEESGEVICDNEAMGPDFVKEVLAKWVDGMRMVWVPCDEHGEMMCLACRDKDKEKGW